MQTLRPVGLIGTLVDNTKCITLYLREKGRVRRLLGGGGHKANGYGLSSCMDWCYITVSLYELCLFLFTECNSCKEGEVCSVVSESNGARYPICKGPTTGTHSVCMYILLLFISEVWF